MQRPHHSLAALGLLTLTAPACELVAGYDELKPRPSDAGVNLPDSATSADAETPDPLGDSGAANDAGTVADAGGGADAASPADAAAGKDAASPPDGSAANDASDATDASTSQDGSSPPDAAVCTQLAGQDACAAIPQFTASEQVVDGVGDEFCAIPAMVFGVTSCPTLSPESPPALPGEVTARVAWSAEALHVHVHVEDPQVLVQSDRARLWDGDAVEIYVAGVSGDDLTGAFDGTKDGGAIQLVLTPPSGIFLARGEAFLSKDGAHAPIDPSLVAGRLVPGGYEVELRYPWAANANPAVSGAKIGFNLGVDVQDDASAGGRELQCIISDVYVDGAQACGFPSGTPAEPYCDDRTWCQPSLSP